MILTQVRHIIPKEFNVKEFLNLSDLTKDVRLYQVLSPLKETVFEKSTRIVIYHSEALTYSFSDLPADSLIQLQKMLVYLDIPNFFCIFVSDDKQIEQELKYICENYAIDETPIEFICLK